MLADLTVTLHAPKVGHFVSPGDRCAGHIVVVPIGIPPACDEQADVFALTSDAVGLLVRPKTEADHKRSVGTVLVAGGSRGMTGAAAMAALGALRSGAGLVHCILPSDLVGEKPYLEVINVAAPGEGRLGRDALAAVRAEMGRLRATALGPGMGRDDDTVALVRELVAGEPGGPLVVDADGLFALGADLELLAGRRRATVLTPHEGELARLLGTTAAEVAAHRLASVARGGPALRGDGAAQRRPHIVAAPDGTAFVVPTGNPGLATPGTGDVLTGIIAGQLAKGLSATEAACLGAYVHGLAADMAVDTRVQHRGPDRERPVRLSAAGGRAPHAGRRRQPTTSTTMTTTDRDGEQVSEDESAGAGHGAASDESVSQDRPGGGCRPARGRHHGARGGDIAPDATVHELVLLLRDKDLGGVPVVDGDGRLVGIVTEGDLVIEDADVRLPHYFELFGNLVYLGGQKKFEERLKKMVGNAVADVMTTEVFTVGPDDPAPRAANIMVDKKVNRVPVVDDDGRLVGIVARHDIIRMLGL